MNLIQSTPLAAALVALVFTFSGCGEQSNEAEQTQPVAPTRLSTDAATVPNQARVVWDSISHYSHQQAAEFRQAVESAASEIRVSAEQAGDQAGTISEETRVKISQATTSLNESLDDLGNATAETWDAAKERVRESYENLRQTYVDRTR